MDISGGDLEQIRGQLPATRLVLQEALGRLPAEQIEDLRASLETVVAVLRDRHNDTAAPEQTHIIDEIDALSLRLRYRDQPIEPPDDAGGRAYVAVCMKCEHFPIDIGESCPQCGTDRWVTTVRS